MPTMISDPIEFELFKNSLFSIADEMALTIFRTTYSGVLKDNMDYSTAMFDGSGKLVAQGLTLPGHLGSMPTGMAAIREAFAGKIEPGDVFILNDPFQGGMHDRLCAKRTLHMDLAGGDIGQVWFRNGAHQLKRIGAAPRQRFGGHRRSSLSWNAVHESEGGET